MDFPTNQSAKKRVDVDFPYVRLTITFFDMQKITYAIRVP